MSLTSTQANDVELADKTPTAFIATNRYRGIFAYSVRLHWNGLVTRHWGGIRNTQPSELQMFGLLRILRSLSPPLRLKAILWSDYLSACLVMASKRKRDAQRGISRRRSKQDDEHWFEAVTLWEIHRVGMREAQTDFERAELQTAERHLVQMMHRYPSPFGDGETLVEGGDSLPFPPQEANDG